MHFFFFLRKVKAAGRQACLVQFSVPAVLDTLLLDNILRVPCRGGVLLEVFMVWGFLIIILMITKTPFVLKYWPAFKASLQERRRSVPSCLFASMEGIGGRASPLAPPQLLRGAVWLCDWEGSVRGCSSQRLLWLWIVFVTAAVSGVLGGHRVPRGRGESVFLS